MIVKKCLITGEVLQDKYITLLCGHTFNYGSIVKEVERQKYSIPKTEVQRLKKDQIKCPYCRNIQNGILPLFDGFDEIKYVNSPTKYSMKCEKCKYTFKYGKRKGLFCNKPCYDTYCKMCERKVLQRKKKIDSKQMKNKVILHKNITEVENVVLPEQVTCQAHIKTGKRAGLVCGRKTKSNSEYCGFHNK